MQQRALGRSGLMVAPLAFGGNVFGWTADEATSFALLDAFVDAGFNLIDTADVYSRWVPGHSGGESETIIGRWLKKSGKRDRVVLATKVGMDMGDGKGPGARATSARRSRNRCSRLQTDHIDLYQSHDDDSEHAARGDARRLRRPDRSRQGARHRRLATTRAARLAEALQTSARLGLPRYESLQPLYNLYGPRRPTKPSWSRCAGARGWASSTSTRWPAAFSPASTAARPMPARARAAAASSRST